jgi:hypothetical protein
VEDRRVFDHLALVIGPILRDMRRRQKVILGWQIATALILLMGFTAIIGVLLVGI